MMNFMLQMRTFNIINAELIITTFACSRNIFDMTGI